ncbi:phospholipase D-like domain-containing protein [Halomonas vilamensis]|uniref:phospholipase D n=1 Tax=Vreelandella vilamensis TaxID=531309 RepID=A0ABU1H517_9GAMM|nr:phospholipase D-like domain-containing protein [Halomonas vilamensis]MDR5898847.1 phospholipase D-like domain-containing protein [Halomonas vilamensis]
MEPKITAHFDDIHQVLLREIGSAKSYIVAAVAWFTDREILNALRHRASFGVSIRIAITDDEINRPPKAPNFDALIDLGGEIHRISPGSRRDSLMHHKFCVIDGTTVITGSYNWTRRARYNKENVTVVHNHVSFATRFIDTFEQIVGKETDGTSILDTDRIRKRLELIRNLIQLGDVEDLPPHIQRLRGVANEAGLRKALTALDTGEYTQALEEIEQWLKRASALVVSEDAEVPYLKLHLEALELEIAALTAEQADLERRLVVFNRRHDDALGDLIQAVLAARAKLKRLHAEKARREEREHAEEAEKAAHSAENQYREYAEEHHRVQAEPPHKELDAESEKTLKQMYRSACRLCHPDKVEEAFKAKATEIFQQLDAAYRTQDIESVHDILNLLQSGGLNLDARSSLLTEASRLRGAIAQVEHHIATTVSALHALKASSAVQLMESIGYSDEAWTTYVDRRQRELMSELHTLEQEIDVLCV